MATDNTETKQSENSDEDRPVMMCAVRQLALAVLAAVVVGVLDAALVVFGIAGAAGAFQYVPARIWIMGPVVWLIVVALIGTAILAFTRRHTGGCVAVVLCVAFAAIRLRAHPVLLVVSLAALFVAVTFLWRVIQRWTTRRLRATVAGIVVVLATLALVGAALPAAFGSLVSRPVASGPNVIVIFLDTVRYDALFDAEGRVHSNLPTLTRLARESTVFTRAYATSPWTLPSHLSAVTGVPSHELGVNFDAQRYERKEETLAERFRRRGYRTAAVISNSFLNAGSGFERGFDIFQQAQAALDLCRTAPGLMADTHWPWFAASVCNWAAGEVTQRARALMHDDERPFFLALNYMDAHDPYYVERGCGGGLGYASAIQCLDRHLAPIVDWRSASRETVLAIVGDHGEQFGEHGLKRHGNSLYVQLLHVPFMIRRTTSARGSTSAAPLSIASLPALLDGADGTGWTGAVLSVLHPPADALLPSEWSALDGSWHLIVRERGSDALYYLPTDPAEERNLIARPPADPAIARLRTAIEMMRRSPKPDLGKFRSLGYIH